MKKTVKLEIHTLIQACKNVGVKTMCGYVFTKSCDLKEIRKEYTRLRKYNQTIDENGRKQNA